MAQARILITDDDDMTLEMLSAALQDDHDITACASGKEAIEAASRQNVDLIVLDVDMPDMDGYATCEALKAQGRTAEVPVIFLSARVNIEERLRGYKVGACDYLTKPFDVVELKTKIELAVSSRARSKELSGQVEEAINTALSTANMYGEVGVVLELQRALGQCFKYEDIAHACFGALKNFGFEGCMRLNGRLGSLSRTGAMACSALENSILDHIESTNGPSIQGMGENTFFRYGCVVFLIRKLPVLPSHSQYSPDDIERFARARDNIALMAEGVIARMRSLDAEAERSRFEQNQRLVHLTRETLVDISAQQHANRMRVMQVLQHMNSEVEQSFIHLGLSEHQEELLAGTLRRHIQEALGVFDQSNQIEQHLHGLIEKLDA
jgi:CheY-like chemotaxis protein